MPPALAVRQLAKTYPGPVVGLHPTELSVEPGEHLALVGPSGSGKSTLLRLIAGLETADAGEVWVNGERVDRLPPHRRGVALLSQRPALYPQMTVKQNLEAVRTPGAALPGFSDELLRLGSLLSRYPHELSGGERQRVALAKLIRRGARVWLLDEPFSALDPQFRAEFRHDLHLLLAPAGATIVVVTHDPIDATALGRRIGVLADGVLRQVGTADDLRTRPGNRVVAYSLGQFCFLDGAVRGTAEGPGEFVSACASVTLPVPPDVASKVKPGDGLTLGLRTDDVRPHTGSGTPTLARWLVTSTEPVSSGRVLTLTSGRSRVRAEWRDGPPPAVGAPTDWTIPAGRGIWFDATTGERL